MHTISFMRGVSCERLSGSLQVLKEVGSAFKLTGTITEEFYSVYDEVLAIHVGSMINGVYIDEDFQQLNDVIFFDHEEIKVADAQASRRHPIRDVGMPIAKSRMSWIREYQGEGRKLVKRGMIRAIRREGKALVAEQLSE